MSGPVRWLRPRPFDGSSASFAEHTEAIGRIMARPTDGPPERLWLGPFEPPEQLPPRLERTVLVVPTSGSTGAAKAVALDREALLASQDATAALLGGPAGALSGHGFWLPLLPPTHIAGIQVIARAHRTAQLRDLAAAALPDPLPDLSTGFGTEMFRRAARTALVRAEAAGLPALTSLVPTQLVRILADAEATALLARFAGVLVGGAATAPADLTAARAAGVAVRTTYGSSETAGGCVYDGVPLPGVHLLLEDGEAGTGRLRISSPTLALGYLRRDGTAEDGGAFSPASSEPDRCPSFLTSDLARLEDGRLRILGRADDVIITGGRKVLPQDVEAAILAHPALARQVQAVVVVGVPDAEWGQRITALVVPHPVTSRDGAGHDGTGQEDRGQENRGREDTVRDDTASAVDAGAAVPSAVLAARLRTALRDGPLPAHAVPKAVLAVAALPLLGIGKIDRAAARRIAEAALPLPS
ncbi:AMP-binding enzyme [Brachybacterium hainanense]|uniref:Acyl-CoA synthetase n=1 Tax=Brachybacterium hainanense TaxID=1541174 RepID=A0ABV6RHF8_9MICO